MWPFFQGAPLSLSLSHTHKNTHTHTLTHTHTYKHTHTHTHTHTHLSLNTHTHTHTHTHILSPPVVRLHGANALVLADTLLKLLELQQALGAAGYSFDVV